MTIFQNFGWLDLLDIGVVSFIIYRVMLLLNRAMAIRLAMGIAFLLILHLASQSAALPALNLLLDNFLGSIIIIMAVIFQSDLRRSIMTSIKTHFPGDRENEEEPEAILEVVKAAETLAAKKIGALIVIERGMEVDNFLDLGTEIDAKVTSELISSIFLPYSPIHDGAVLIQNGKLTRAGCFLPLTQNPEVSMALGTRHRAAIGLTEVVDSLVVVVSEETGGISAVFGGRITRNLDPSTLRKVMKSRLAPWFSQWGK